VAVATTEWHALPAAETLRLLGSGADGLSAPEAQARLVRDGPNELAATPPPSAWSVLGRQFRNALVLLLLAAICLSAILGHGVETAAIAVIVALAVLLGFAQEYRAERALEALRRMTAPQATVVRAAQELRIPAREVVPGDVLLLRAGDRVPADARVLTTVGLQVDEAALTGESLPVDKQAAPMSGPALALGDRTSMVFGGTLVTGGRGSAVTVATGGGTELGRIAELLGTVRPARTPLQASLDRLGTVLVRAALLVVLGIVALGALRGTPPLELLLFGVALAVAVVPEALPAVVTVSLALGVQRLARRNALVRRLPAAEALGSVSVICSDKTGTLTRDEMTVREVRVPSGPLTVTGAGYDTRGEVVREGRPIAPPDELQDLLRAAVLASDARLEEGGGAPTRVHGDPTEGALLVAARKTGLDRTGLEASFPRVGERAFTPERKRMTTFHRGGAGAVAFTKGAPETVLAACARVAEAGGERPLDAAGRERWLAAADAMAGRALRVLAVARRADLPPGGGEEGFTLLGLAGMMDAPRPEASDAVRRCADAGVRVAMITGDHPSTARAVARELGVLRDGAVLTGAELARLGDAELEEVAGGVEVYARVSPADKLRVVIALQARGEVVAMTGDGVNDAPALKRADIGIAMGLTGTDVSREAAGMVLTDDNFASIVAAVEEARTIFANIRKFLSYLLSSNAGEIGLMAGASLLGLPLPLSAALILYVNLATDGLPALALAVDPADPDVMHRAPRRPWEGVFTRPLLFLILVGGAWSTAVNLGLFAWALASGRPLGEAMTMTFVSLVLIELGKAFLFRSDRSSVFRRPFANRWLDLAVAWELALLSAVVYLPPLQRALGTFPLSPRDWLVVAPAVLSIVPVMEGGKALVRRGWFGARRAGGAETPPGSSPGRPTRPPASDDLRRGHP
jgi:Ca2+-transporting ATPase